MNVTIINSDNTKVKSAAGKILTKLNRLGIDYKVDFRKYSDGEVYMREITFYTNSPEFNDLYLQYLDGKYETHNDSFPERSESMDSDIQWEGITETWYLEREAIVDAIAEFKQSIIKPVEVPFVSPDDDGLPF